MTKVKNKKADLKLRGQSPQTKIAQSLELYLLQKAGEMLYPNKKVLGSIIFLVSQKDTSTKFDDVFEDGKQKSFIYHHFENNSTINELHSRIESIMNDKKVCSDKKKCSNCSFNDICNYEHNDISKLKKVRITKKAGANTSFTNSQLDFINSNFGIYRVLAGAGSGKTTSTANRVINLLKNGFSPKEILLITYTTKGVMELKEKISYWLKVNGMNFKLKDFNIFTFNNFCFDLIKAEYKYLGFSKEPNVLDKNIKMEIINDLLDSHDKISFLNYSNPFLDLYRAKGSVVETMDLLETLKLNSAIFEEDVKTICSIKDDNDVSILYSIYCKYLEVVKSKNLLDFNDQINLGIKLLSNNKFVEKYGFEHIIVDEFQDSNASQLYIIKELMNYRYFTSLAVLGDDAQSIFSWNGATQENILHFNETFENVIDINLNENFRSNKHICDFANKLNSLNVNSLDKQLISNKEGLKPILTENSLKDIVELIEDTINTKTHNPEDIAIITRNKDELLEAKELLDALNIPNVIAVSELLIDNKKVRNIIEYSNLLVDDTLELPFAKYIQMVKYEEFKSLNFDDKITFIKNEKANLLAELNKCTSEKDKIKLFIDTITPLAQSDKSVNRLIEVIKENKFDNVSALVKFLNDLITYKSDLFVEKDDCRYKAVTLTTAHSSKGREFKMVFLSTTNFKAGNPSFNTSLNTYDFINTPEIEEERRLFYVGVTRAMDELIIFGNKNRVFFSQLDKILNDYLSISNSNVK